MRRFDTQGPVNPKQHYVGARTEELTIHLDLQKYKNLTPSNFYSNITIDINLVNPKDR